jgi:AcrR family transcriptional regulator
MTPARGRSAAGSDTRQRILDAALQTLTEEGIAGTSARAIAARGDFNQALIFYHFGTVPDLIVAAVRSLSEARLERYRARLDEVTTLTDLAVVAEQMHDQDMSEGHVTVLAQVLAGASSFPTIRGDLLAVFQPWMDLVEGVVRRLTKDSPLAFLVPAPDIAFAVSGLFVGIELLVALDDDPEREQRLFAMFEAAAALLQGVVQLSGQTPPPST